ncbi:Phasin family protein OS=Castellaniella defragrans OX=75697 GN=HNR28_001221 PE=4 SV=1 [Castellaniella defragrans]
MNDIRRQAMENQRAMLRGLVALQKVFFDGYEQLVDLNMQVVRAGFEEATQKSNNLDDAHGFLAFTPGMAPPDAERMLAYSQQVGEIMRKLQAELADLYEAHMAQCQKQVDQATRAVRGSRKDA